MNYALGSHALHRRGLGSYRGMPRAKTAAGASSRRVLRYPRQNPVCTLLAQTLPGSAFEGAQATGATYIKTPASGKRNKSRVSHQTCPEQVLLGCPSFWSDRREVNGILLHGEAAFQII